MKLRQIGILLLMSLLAVSSFGADLNLKESTVRWQGTKVTGRHYGDIQIKKGSLDVDSKTGLVKGGEIVIDMDSFKADDLSGEWEQKFYTHLKGPDFFEIKKHPTATLKVKSVDGYTVKADLTIKGKTQEVEFVMAGSKKDFFGTLVFDRTKFGVVYGSGDFFKGLGDKTIHNEVTLAFNLKLK